MRDLLDLLKWFLLGSLIGFPLGMELAGGADRLTMTQGAVMYTLMVAGMCLLAILVMKKLGFIGGKSEHS